MYKLISVEGNNFKSFEHFKLDMAEGIHLIQGINNDDPTTASNGSGKTTVFDAVIWCQSGSTIQHFRGRSTSSLDAVNLKHPRNCWVETIWQTPKHNVRIRRKVNCDDGDGILVEIDGQNISGNKAVHTQADIDQLIPANYDTLKSILIMSQNLHNRFSEMSPNDRVFLLEQIRDYTIWDRVREKANAEMYQLSQQKTTNKSEIDRSTGVIEVSDRIIARKQSERLTWENTIVDPDKLGNILRKIEVLKSKVLEKRSELAKIDKKRAQVDRADGTLKRIGRPHISGKQLAEGIITALERDLKHSHSKVEESVKLLTETQRCPTCKQEIAQTEETKKNIAESITELKAKSRGIREQLEAEKIRFAEAQRQVERLTARSDLILKIAKSYNPKINALNLEIEEINALINQFQIQANDMENAQKNKEAMLTAIDNEIKENEDSKVKAQGVIDTKTAENDKLDLERRRFSFFYDSLGPKGNLRPYLTSKDVRLLNKALKYYTHKFFSSVDIRLTEPTLDSRIIDIVIATHSGLNKKLSMLSVGERKKLDLCIQFSIYDLIKSTASLDFNFLVLDEVFDGLDDVAIIKAMEVIKERQENIPCIYVVSHREGLKSTILSQYTVEKTDDQSVLHS